MVAIEELAPSWMPPAIARAWLTEYTLAGAASVPGSSRAATEMVRNDSKYRNLYDSHFPGNRRNDGSLRLDEGDYFNRVESYRNALTGVNVNPNIFEDKFAGLIEGDVGEGEFVQRVESMYERVIEAAPALRDYYAANFALDMTDSAIIASFLDPDVGNKVLDRQIAISEIGGEAEMRKFNIDVGFAETLQQAGVGREQAQNLFGQAAMDVPALNVLARRHVDPDDDFDINEFTKAAIFDDPTQRRRMRRLMAQERSSFAQGTGRYKEDRSTGGLSGLTER